MSATEIIGLDPRSGHPICVSVEGGVIARIAETQHPSDLYLSAGLIDLQVNGYTSFDLNSDQLSPDTALHLVDAMLAGSVTCFAPTLVTAPEEDICHRLGIISDVRRNHPRIAACVPFVHVEGPHSSPTSRVLALLDKPNCQRRMYGEHSVGVDKERPEGLSFEQEVVRHEN